MVLTTVDANFEVHVMNLLGKAINAIGKTGRVHFDVAVVCTTGFQGPAVVNCAILAVVHLSRGAKGISDCSHNCIRHL